MNTTRRGATLFALGLLASSASAQLAGPYSGTPSFYLADVLADPGASGLTALLTDDISLRPSTNTFTLGGEVFTRTTPAAGDWVLETTAISVEVAVITFLGSEAADVSGLGQFYLGTGPDVLLFENYDLLTPGTTFEFWPTPGFNAVSFYHHSMVNGAGVTQFDPSVFSIFTANIGGLDYILMGIEEGGAPADQDFDDLLVMFQIGLVIESAHAPEPATYGVAAAALVAGLALHRRRRQQRTGQG